MKNVMEVVRTIKIKADNLPKRLKEARIKDGRSVQALATYAGISTAYWYQIEKGDRNIVSEETIRKIEEVLGINLEINFKSAIAA